MDNKIIPSFRDSVFTNALGDPSLDILEIGIDYSDAQDIIKNLKVENYQYTQYSTKSNFGYMHIFFKEIKNKNAYIKIAFKNDKTIVISFHERIYD